MSPRNHETPRNHENHARLRRALVAAVAIGGLLCLSARADAHRLDEYLQATLISVDGERVRVEIALTPGANVARAIIRSIDTDDDGAVSAAEADAYARRVLADVSLVVDGRRLALTLEEPALSARGQKVPDVEAMTLGTGTIHLSAVAEIPQPPGEHALVYRNDHRPDASVYLVNALAPRDRRVRLAAQRRDALQHSLAFDYEVASGVRNAEAGWIVIAAAMIALITAGRSVRRTAIS